MAISEKYGVTRIHITLAWLLQKGPVKAPIIDATKISYLKDELNTLRVKLSTEEMSFLKEPYVPHPMAEDN